MILDLTNRQTKHAVKQLPMFIMSSFEISKGALKQLEYYWSRFIFKQGNNAIAKIPLAKRDILCCPKDQGDLDTKDRLIIYNASDFK